MSVSDVPLTVLHARRLSRGVVTYVVVCHRTCSQLVLQSLDLLALFFFLLLNLKLM